MQPDDDTKQICHRCVGDTYLRMSTGNRTPDLCSGRHGAWLGNRMGKL